jgi:hypothetical protein
MYLGNHEKTVTEKWLFFHGFEARFEPKRDLFSAYRRLWEIVA